MTYEGLNGCIDEYNLALKTKYDFYLRGFQAMSSIKDKKKFKEMKAQENRDTTKGVYFVVGEDMKGCAILKGESARRSIFAILRHFQRIKEIRGPGPIIRYAIL